MQAPWPNFKLFVRLGLQKHKDFVVYSTERGLLSLQDTFLGSLAACGLRNLSPLVPQALPGEVRPGLCPTSLRFGLLCRL